MNDSWKDTIVNISRPVRIAVVCVFAALAVFLIAKSWQTFKEVKSMYAPASITVTGTGKASAVPNIASINFTVQETALAVSDAQEKATKKTNAALSMLKEMKIEEKDITTSGYNVNPQYANQPICYGGICPPQTAPKITGYQVNQSIEVKVRDIGKTGDILSKLGSLEIQNIYGPNFTLDDDSAIVSEARGKAIGDAQEKAKQLAKQLGVSLGSVLNFCDENCSYNSDPRYMKESVMGADSMNVRTGGVPQIPVGEQKMLKVVQITYEIR
jgi:uncharacterized protein